MSSPIADTSEAGSQAKSALLNDDTPSTTPLVVSNSSTPAPEVNMIDATDGNSESQNVEDNIDDMEIAESDEEYDTDQKLSLPIAKIKRIFKLDPDFLGASQSAVYATGLATELFIQYFAEQASLLAKMDKRKKLQYKDFSNAVGAHDSLNFLSDTVPKTQPLEDLIKKKKINLTKADEELLAQSLEEDVNVANTADIIEVD